MLRRVFLSSWPSFCLMGFLLQYVPFSASLRKVFLHKCRLLISSWFCWSKFFCMAGLWPGLGVFSSSMSHSRLRWEKLFRIKDIFKSISLNKFVILQVKVFVHSRPSAHSRLRCRRFFYAKECSYFQNFTIVVMVNNKIGIITVQFSVLIPTL